MSITLRSVGVFGVFLFGLLFSVTFASPETVENSAKGFVKYQIEKEVRAKQQAVSQSSVSDKALDIAEKLGFEKENIQDNIDDKLSDKIASIIASMCGYDCEKKQALAQSIRSGYLERIKSIQVAERTLSDIIKGKYIEILGNIKADLRIFIGTNFVMFFILLSMSFAKPKSIPHLFLPGLLLLAATVLSSMIYIFGQDWFYTILHNDYMGFGYLVYIAIIFGVLVDISFNKARATTEIINGIANAVGSAFSVVPC